MRKWFGFGAAGLTVVAGLACGAEDDAQASSVERLNPMVALHQQDQPVFGLYAPEADPPEVKPSMEVARETVAYTASDYVFNGSMEGGVERGMPAFREFMASMLEAGATARTHPLVVKMEKISADPDAVEHVGQQLNAGVSGIMFVDMDSAEELLQGLNAMRFQSHGGTRRDDVGTAPAYWGMTEEQYREKADLWPLNPSGELIAWAVIETPEGLENVRKIAAVPGLGVLWPGAGTLRGVFSTTGPNGERVLDEDAWESAIQKVLSACKEFHVPCGYPAGDASALEMRMRQGFSVFVAQWGDTGFQAVDLGRRLSGR